MSDDPAALDRFIRRFRPPCPRCGRRLGPLIEGCCPECGCGMTMRGVLRGLARPRRRVLHVLLDGATGLALCFGLVVFLGNQGRRSGADADWGCFLLVLFVTLVAVRVQVRKRSVVVVELEDPLPLHEYLAEEDVACPACGYNLRGLTGDRCPECDRTLSVQSLVEHAVHGAGVGPRQILDGLFTAFVMCVSALAAAAVVLAVFGWFVAVWWSPIALLAAVVLWRVGATAVFMWRQRRSR